MMQSKLTFDHKQLLDALACYCSSSLFTTMTSDILMDSPFKRSIVMPATMTHIFKKTIPYSEINSSSALFCHRVLFNVYEQDFIYLPLGNHSSQIEEFKLFYSPELRRLGNMIKPELESILFGFLEQEINITGTWTETDLQAYFTNLMQAKPTPSLRLTDYILSMPNPKRAMRNFTIQCAGDFLTEASGMARNILGNFGEMQSALFKVLIDEYGYGVHATKHSTLYEKILKDQNLTSIPQAYWNYYLPSSLLMHNYIHYVSSNHASFFRYLGALFYAEATYSEACKHISSMIKTIFGAEAETGYFDEHAHIDLHHRKMVYDQMIVPSLKCYGTTFVPDLVRGYEEFKLLLGLLDDDLIAQLEFIKMLEQYKQEGEKVYGQVKPDTLKNKLEHTTEFNIADTKILIHINSGTIKLCAGYDADIILSKGDSFIVPQGRLYGCVATTEDVDAFCIALDV